LADGKYELQYPYFVLEPVITVQAKRDYSKPKAGDVVQCVDVGANTNHLTCGKLYTVKSVNSPFIHLEDPDSGRQEVGFYSHRFIPSTKPSIQTAKPITVDQALQEAEKQLTVAVLDRMCQTIHAKNVAAGWWDQADNPLVVPVKLMLTVSELAEAMEGDRKNIPDTHLTNRSMLAVELADAVIRIVDLAGFLNIPLGTIIAEKEAYNASRADHKPENRAQAGGKRY
jgi:NTP pyrophosphatase (non-canonical NTP hydrolase)